MLATDRLPEQGAWKTVPNGWRQLYGDFDTLGLSIEWHDFLTARTLDWGRSFHPHSIEFCLNLDGRGEIGRRIDYAPGSSGFYATTDEPLNASRLARERHQFATLEFSRPYLQKHLDDCQSALDPVVRTAVFDGKNSAVMSEPRAMTVQQRDLVVTLMQPPVPKAAQALWYQSKATELLAHFLFTPKDPELFCMRQKRVARERVERVKELLARNLATPPSLETLGQEVGCSQFYLSRTFSREVGLTIPQYLRKLRMQRAAELLRSGHFNVTEAAIEVGYNSMSHFSKAFCETIGCCPALYPMAKHTILEH